MFPRAGAHSGAGGGHFRASPTLTERSLSIRRGRRLSLPPSQAAHGHCNNPAAGRARKARRGSVTCPWSQRYKVAEPEFAARSVCLQVPLSASQGLRARPGLAALVYRERGVCMGVRVCVGWG